MRIQRNFAAILALVAALTACGGNDAPAPANSAPTAKAGPTATAPIEGDRALSYVDNANEPLVLNTGDSAGGAFVVPGSGRLSGLGVYIGTFANTSTGVLRLELCKAEKCVSGVSDLKNAPDNSIFAVSVNPPLDVTGGDTVRYRFVKDSGDARVALWSYPAAADGPRGISVSDGRNLGDRTLRLTLQFSGK
jgi:hypothetical protein